MIDVPAAALDAATAARVTLVIGVVDAGKTTLVTRLAAALASPGDLVGVVDADLGQSDIGPPTTVGLGLVHGAIDRLDQAEVVALEFLGVTSPAHCLRQTASATARLVKHALEIGCRRVLVNTSGLVEGNLGRALKRFKIGDPNQTISGAQTYRIEYRIGQALNAFPDHDELYWNATLS